MAGRVEKRLLVTTRTRQIGDVVVDSTWLKQIEPA